MFFRSSPIHPPVGTKEIVEAKKMRIAVAEIGQETDSFSSLVTGLDSFEQYGLYLGDEILEKMPGVGMIGGFLEV